MRKVSSFCCDIEGDGGEVQRAALPRRRMRRSRSQRLHLITIPLRRRLLISGWLEGQLRGSSVESGSALPMHSTSLARMGPAFADAFGIVANLRGCRSATPKCRRSSVLRPSLHGYGQLGDGTACFAHEIATTKGDGTLSANRGDFRSVRIGMTGMTPLFTDASPLGGEARRNISV